MSQTNRPILTLDIECQIEQAQNQIHMHYWPRLQQMQDFTSEARDQYLLVAPHRVPVVPTPKSPNALRVLLRQYAIALFDSEAEHYPDEKKRLFWMTALKERVIAIVLEKIVEVEREGRSRYVSLIHHLSAEAMGKAVTDGLNEHVHDRWIASLSDETKRKFDEIHQHAVAQSITDNSITSAQTERPEVPERRKPVAQLRKAFVDPILAQKGWSILDWAKDANVDHATAMDYWQGKTKPYASTRKKLAHALGVKIEQLPE